MFYDYYGAWKNPIPEDKEKYLCELAPMPIREAKGKLTSRIAARIGPLAQAAPNIGPIVSALTLRQAYIKN